jgi:hypothetical protein
LFFGYNKKIDKMKKIISFIMLFFAVFSIKAQIITGHIVDKNNSPVDYATVVLQTPDSIYVNSAYTDSLGRFQFQSNLSEFRLIIQHLLYLPYENSFSTQDAGTILLSEKENVLSEVVVKGERPLVQIVNGLMTYDVERLVENKIVNNAYESLLQLPGVIEQDGQLTLIGANNLTVLINGKPSTMTQEQLTQFLKNMPVSMLEKAEVMYSAPPQYHVRGGAINIIMREKHTADKKNLQGQFNSTYTQRFYARYSAKASLFYTTPQFSADFMYSFGRGTSRSGENIYSYHLFQDQIYDIEQTEKRKIQYSNHNFRLGTAYKLKGDSKINMSYTSTITPQKNGYNISDGTFSQSTTQNRQSSPTQMHNAALSYTTGSGLDAGVDYTLYSDHSIQDFRENMPDKEQIFSTKANQDVNRFNAYLDRTHSLQNKWTINYGAKFSFANEHNLQKYFSETGFDLSYLNADSRQQEHTYTAYAGFTKNFSEKLSLIASLSGEYYTFEDYDEWSIFPSLQATYTYSPQRILQLSFSSDKAYPPYWAMSGTTNYIGYSEIQGNTNLIPSKDYTSQLTYILKSKYIFSAFFTHQDKYFVQLPYQSPERLALIFQTINFDFKQQAGVNAVLPFNIKNFWLSRLTLFGFYNRAKSSHFHDLSFDNQRCGFYAKLNNTIVISSKPNIKAETEAAYADRNIQGPMNLGKMWYLNAGVKWIFADNKAELSLKGADFFDTWSPDVRMKYATQNFRMKVVPDSRNISLSFTYKFGGEITQSNRKEVDTSRFGKGQ